MGDLAAWTDTSGPDDVYWLTNGRLMLGAVPALGGRLLSLQLDGAELIYRNSRLIDDHLHRLDDTGLPALDGTLASWRNYGGDKTWPAPQGWSGPGEWAGPPDPVLDSGPYVPEMGGDTDQLTLRMTSQPDQRSGLQATRTLRLFPGATEFELTQQFQALERPVRWAIWNVLQLRAEPSGDPHEGWYAGVVDEPNAVVELLSGTGFPAFTIDGGVMFVPCQPVVGKLGVPGAVGWLTTVLGGTALTQRFSPVVGALYPDRGSKAEIWMEFPLERGIAHLGGLKPQEYIIESEILGPLVSLAPSESTSLTVTIEVGPFEPRPV